MRDERCSMVEGEKEVEVKWNGAEGGVGESRKTSLVN